MKSLLDLCYAVAWRHDFAVSCPSPSTFLYQTRTPAAGLRVPSDRNALLMLRDATTPVGAPIDYLIKMELSAPPPPPLLLLLPLQGSCII